MLSWIRNLFGSGAEEIDPRWQTMRRMDPWLSYDRFLRLDLTDEQRPVVKGLVDGTITPAELPPVKDWAQEYLESEDGVDALLFALQHTLGSDQVTYLFPTGDAVPAARFPRLIDEESLTVLFNDREGHIQIASLAEFLTANEIGEHTLEKLDPLELEARITRRARKEVLDRRRKESRTPKKSLSFERKANEAGEVAEPVTADEIIAALADGGYQATVDDLLLSEPLAKLGLYNVELKLPLDGVMKLSIWVVPAVESDA